MNKSLFLLFFLVISVFGIENKKQLDHVVLQLHWKYQFEFAGFIMAKEKGFYKDVGLDVELREYQNGMDVESEVLLGHANYGIYNSRLLLDYLKGKPITLLASFFKRAALVLIAQPDIKTLKDLEGKKVMSATKKDFLINFQSYFTQNGVDIEKINIVPHTYNLQPFIDKKVAALTAFISDQPYLLRKEHIPFKIFDPSDDNLFIMQMELFTSQKEFETYPNRTKKFVQASIKGWEYALEHKDETIDVLLKKYHSLKSKEELWAEAKAIEKLILPYTYEIGSIDKGFIKKQAKLFIKNYHLKTPQNWMKYFFDPYQTQEVEFTFKELKYLKTHQNITICPHYGLFPIDGIVDKKETGIMGDIFQIISKKTGLVFSVVASKDFETLQRNIKEKKCQVLSIATKEIAKRFNLYATKSIYEGYFTIITAIDRSFIKEPSELAGKKLLIKDPYLYEYLKKLYPLLDISLEKCQKEMVQKVLNQKAYGIITLDAQSDYFIDEYGFGKLKLGGFLAKEYPIKAVIAVQKDEPILASIIQKTLYSLPEQKIRDIVDSWHMTRYHTKTDYRLLFAVIGIMAFIVLIMGYYQRRIKQFNADLEKRVFEKTKELLELNEQLEAKVKEKVEEIIQKDRLLAIQSKQAIMGEMITMIAHQWRQPLNTLTLQISNLQIRRMMGELVDIKEYDKTLEHISKTITYLSETIDDFQTFFHPDRKLNEIYLEELIQKGVNFIKPRLKGKEIEIILEVQENKKIKVYINELIQVLLNILNNAIDALESCHKEEKRIIIKTDINEEINISICDSACGIDPDNIERLFEPYFSTKGKNGTGLGLYMSQMIMQKQFGGDIEVKSSKQGSCFIITFPLF